jgi:hypothetical protein
VRVLVCGGRDFNNPDWMSATLGELARDAGWSAIIEGGALGADRRAREAHPRVRDATSHFTVEVSTIVESGGEEVSANLRAGR